MSEISEQTPPNDKSIAPALSNARILRLTAGIAAIAVLLGLIFGTRQFAFGLFIGGGLALINYYWLQASLRNLFEKVAVPDAKPRFLAARYFLRYATLGAIVMIVYLTKAASIVGVLLGLCTFALAVVIEGFIRIFISANSKKEEF